MNVDMPAHYQEFRRGGSFLRPETVRLISNHQAMWFSPLLGLLFLHFTSVVAPSPPGWQVHSRSMGPTVGMQCSGEFPIGFEYMLNPNHNRFVDMEYPNLYYQNLLQICASSQFGGRPPSAGAHCSSLSENPNSVLFDYRGHLFGDFIFDDRLILYCYSKCWCDGGRSGDITPLIGRVPLELPTMVAYRKVDPDQLSQGSTVQSIFAISEAEVGPGDHFSDITFLFENPLLSQRYQALIIRYTGTAEGRVTCEGPMPTLPIPRAVGTYYENLQQVCAAAIYGGSSNGNIGGYCSSTNPLGKNYYVSEFFIDGSLGSQEAVNILYCYAHCYCADPETNRPEADLYQRKIVASGRVADMTRKGSWIQVKWAHRERIFKIVRVSENHVNIENVRQSANQVNIVSDRTHGPPAADENVYTVDIDPDLSEPPTRQCPDETHCNGPANCNGCACHVNSSISNMDPISRKMVFPYGVCGGLVVPAIAIAAGLVNQHSLLFQTLFRDVSGGKLSGRAVGYTEDGKEDGVKLLAACACNASYVSIRCCQTMDGLIWESPELQLGYVA